MQKWERVGRTSWACSQCSSNWATTTLARFLILLGPQVLLINTHHHILKRSKLVSKQWRRFHRKFSKMHDENLCFLWKSLFSVEPWFYLFWIVGILGGKFHPLCLHFCDWSGGWFCISVEASFTKCGSDSRNRRSRGHVCIYSNRSHVQEPWIERRCQYYCWAGWFSHTLHPITVKINSNLLKIILITIGYSNFYPFWIKWCSCIIHVLQL